jgi:hypothetical protein
MVGIMTTALLVILGATSLAHVAQADITQLAAAPLQAPAAAEAATEGPGPKSEGLATGFALGGSLVGPLLITSALLEGNAYDSPLHAEFWPLLVAGGASMVLGPSLGNWYSGTFASRGLGWRVGGAAVTAIGVTVMASSFGLFADQGSDSGMEAGLAMSALGAGMILGGTLSDVVSAPHAAANYNRRHGVAMSFAPIVSHANGAPHTGLALVGTF